jgi:hypothetical protein
MSESVNFTTPVGRLVMGSLYKAQTTDAENRPLVIKTGPNAGQPRVDYFFALAIPKGSERHWAETEWGRKVWETGHKSFPNGQATAPTFAWKIVDGDSTIPNKAGRKPCDREGYKGHWVVHFSGGYAPRIFNADGSAPIVEPDAVKLGYYVQVAGSVAGNESMQQPGVYINHSMVALAGYGPEIIVGPDPTQAGFGAAPLPPGASAVPVGGFTAPATPAPAAAYAPPAPPGAPAAASAPVYTPPAPTPVAAAPAAPAAPAMVVQPHPGFLAGPGAAPPPPVVGTPVRLMLPAAGQITYEQYIANGWTDALLVQHGMMAPT